MWETALFGAACAVQLGYWLTLSVGFRRAASSAAAHSSAELPPVSVVVAARDEEKHLPSLLAALSRQTHPSFEVVVVDDGSADGTAALLRGWRQRLPFLRVVHAAREGKKGALTRGIREARHEILLFTDADCEPPNTWVEGMARQHVGPSCEVLIGHSPFTRESGSILNAVARYETCVTAFFAAAAAGLRRPYMAVGRNLSYPKRVFDRIEGFDHSMASLSGDDDLLIQEIRRRSAADGIRAVLDPQTFVATNAPATWREWIRQKRRHASAGRFYARDIQAHLALFHLSNLVVWLAPIFAGWTGLALLGAKLVTGAMVLSRAAAVLGDGDLIAKQPALDLAYLAYQILVAPAGLARRPRKW